MDDQLAVKTNGLTRRFGKFTAVDRIDLTIDRGCIYGFLGPNGSGKSTTIRMLCGILQPTEGTGRVLGLDIAEDSELIKQNIGYMSQKFSLYNDLTVLENLEFYCGMYSITGADKRERIAEMLEMAGLKERQHELTVYLSGGWKQRLALGCSILHQPSILFLDEPTGGVDPKSRRMFWDIIYAMAERGTTIMVTTHFMDEAEHCDEIGFIYEGRLVASGTPAHMKQQLNGTLVAIESRNPLELLEEISSQQLPLQDIYVHGTRLHILIDNHNTEALQKWSYSIIEPTMEDVFVQCVKSSRKGGALI